MLVKGLCGRGLSPGGGPGGPPPLGPPPPPPHTGGAGMRAVPGGTTRPALGPGKRCATLGHSGGYCWWWLVGSQGKKGWCLLSHESKRGERGGRRGGGGGSIPLRCESDSAVLPERWVTAGRCCRVLLLLRPSAGGRGPAAARNAAAFQGRPQGSGRQSRAASGMSGMRPGVAGGP